jgi:predicted amidophosphoribosyltransferase
MFVSFPDWARFDAIVPVPLYSRRRRSRGFNQSESLARGLARLSGLTLRSDVLRRTRETVPQAGLSDTARRQNLKGARSAPPCVHQPLEQVFEQQR